MKLCKPIITFMLVILFCTIIIYFQYITIISLENDLQYHKQTSLKGNPSMGFSGDNFVGIVCNTGYYTAYDAKLILYTDTWSYPISLDNLTEAQFVEINEYIPIPPENIEIRNNYLSKFEYSDTPK